MLRSELKKLLQDIRRGRIAVLGDFCLDAYWHLDPKAAEFSLETGLPTRAVRDQRYAPGGAGTIAMNLLAAGVGHVRVLGVVGEDLFGRELTRLLAAGGADVSGLLVQEEAWQTHVYLKPCVGGREESRLDFGNFNRLHDRTASALLRHLEEALAVTDIAIVNEQVINGVHGSSALRAGLSRLIRAQPAARVIIDSRHRHLEYPPTIRKLNVQEAVRLCGAPRRLKLPIGEAAAQQAARDLYARWRKPVFMSRGPLGCLVADEVGVQSIPALRVPEPTDTVGAGDSLLAGIAAALAVGRDHRTAAQLGTYMAGVTVRKLLQTGTAAPAEILAAAAE
jgi:sugar/nucleoside kinase (ribokinase family)